MRDRQTDRQAVQTEGQHTCPETTFTLDTTWVKDSYKPILQGRKPRLKETKCLGRTFALGLTPAWPHPGQTAAKPQQAALLQGV